MNKEGKATLGFKRSKPRSGRSHLPAERVSGCPRRGSSYLSKQIQSQADSVARLLIRDQG